ncbi:gp063R [Rabbit fibroma virus]|uniref:Probable host range protein 2-2 n=1 Tax=Rabbit fibroma virus (strain Kasza) TaxID=10272 RepID=VH22_RFVKA|nr:gp063R [Rabbit fibroma virus]Q9Q908.1 RecName: Full=Probable host range protein 2-2 [Rabbit fibroma virus (strain Kasza)]AAF17945.1 gp063R [Rabbit fibroma virus]
MTITMIDMEVYLVDENLSIKNAGLSHGYSCGCILKLDITSPKKVKMLVITKVTSFQAIQELKPLNAKLNGSDLDTELVKCYNTTTDLTVYKTSAYHRDMPDKEYCVTRIYSVMANIDSKSTIEFYGTTSDEFLSAYPVIYINPEEKYYKVKNKGRLQMRVITPILNSDKLQFMAKGDMYAGVGDDPSIVDSSDSDEETDYDY